jgi:very-short-patch-repair endonuclease
MQARLQVVDVLRAHGGAARWSQLDGRVSRRALQQAASAGDVVVDRGTYYLPEADYVTRVARRLKGIRSHRSAAEHWQLALPPRGEDPRHDIAIPPNAAPANVPSDVTLHYLELLEEDIEGDVLTPLATAAYCLRDLSTRDALSVGDSSLRSGQVQLCALRTRVAALRNRGAARARSRLDLLDGRSANAFESCCRVLLIEAGITGFEPQVTIRHNGFWIGRVDLAHRQLRIVIECDGFETHGTIEAMTKDCTRHTCLVSAGWLPLRFTWHQVMFQPLWVIAQVRDTIAAAQRCTH